MNRLRDDALAIFSAALNAVRPGELLRAAFAPGSPLADAVARAPRVIVVGAGKAGASMATGLEVALGDHLEKVEGLVNVPDSDVRPLKRIRLHAARPAGSNHPTAEGVTGTEAMLGLLESAGADDVAICLISGGGSALLPAPADGVTLADKQATTKLLHAAGARIDDMNCVRKHLSRVKGGRLAQAFRGRALFSLVLSDVVGDPLDVIASGPTAADPSTFADAIGVLKRYALIDRVPTSVRELLERGERETLKALPSNVHNVVIGNNALALRVAASEAESRGYRMLNLGSFVEGESREVAVALASVARSIRRDGVPIAPPACVLLGGETTVALGGDAGKGGRNQEFVLAAMHHLGRDGMADLCVLSAGTDGEDGPTDAAGAVVDDRTPFDADAIERHLAGHDAYPLLDALGALIRTQLTQTNVMDVRMLLLR